jgi:hypothetical protein
MKRKTRSGWKIEDARDEGEDEEDGMINTCYVISIFVLFSGLQFLSKGLVPDRFGIK